MGVYKKRDAQKGTPAHNAKSYVEAATKVTKEVPKKDIESIKKK